MSAIDHFNDLVKTDYYKNATTTQKMRMLKDLKHESYYSGFDANYEFYHLFDEVEKENESLKLALKEAVEVIEFYGDTNNYGFLETEKDSKEYHIKDRWMIDEESDFEQFGDRVQWGVTVPKMFGGKRAREFLAKHKDKIEANENNKQGER